MNSDDARNTPAEPFRDIVIEGGGEVTAHDPWVDSYQGIPIDHDINGVLTGADAVVIFTGYSAYRKISQAGIRKACGNDPLVIVDGRNVINPGVFIRAGFIYKGIGRGDWNEHLIGIEAP